MIKKVFIILGIIGVITISILAFVIPKDPFITLPTINQYPLWFSIIVGGNFIYLIILYSIYCKITN